MVTKYDCLYKYKFRKMSFNNSVLTENVIKEEESALSDLIPKKSKDRYQKSYETFKQWQDVNKIMIISENVMLAYFEELVSFYN